MAITIDGNGITSNEIADGSISAADLDIGQIGGRRNLIINGAMQVAQRGTSFTDADTYSLDRWRLNTSGETMAVTQQSFTAGQTDVPMAEKYLRTVITTTGNNAGMTHRIEGVEQLSGQTVTLSFYARGGQGGQGVPTTFRSYLNQNFGSGGSTAVNVQGSTNHTLTTSWQLFTATVTLGSTSGKTIGTSPYTELVFQQTTGEACDFDIALVQLEVGSVATPFEHRSYGEELALCQRYYEKSWNQGEAPSTTNTSALGIHLHGGSDFTATASFLGTGAVVYKVEKRTNPSLTIYDSATPRNTNKCQRFKLGVTGANNSAITIDTIGTRCFSGYSPSGTSATGVLFHWTADAEL